MKPSILAAALTLAIATGSAFAQPRGPNGGLVAGSSDHQVELVIAPAEITVYLLDDGKVTPVQGANVRAVVQEGGRTTTVALAVAGANRLTGRLQAPLASGARLVVSGRDGHNHSVSARFVVP